MSSAESDRALFRASLQRATRAPDFFQRFYDRFMGESPEIRAFFHHKDIGDIHRKLKMTLEMLADSAEGQPGLSLYLEMLGRTHARLAIRPEHFARWREALVTTAAECDPELDAATRCAWGRIIDDLIAQLSTASEHAQGES